MIGFFVPSPTWDLAHSRSVRIRYSSFGTELGRSTNKFFAESGNLQATLFIQIATSLFEKLECLLGLPPELRITIRAVDRGGLCVEDDFQEVIKSVLSKDEMGRPENGKGGVASLRKNMKKSMQLLRESIAP